MILIKHFILICFLWTVCLEGRRLPTFETSEQKICCICLKPFASSALRLIVIERIFQFICMLCLQKKGGGENNQLTAQAAIPWRQSESLSFEEYAAALEYQLLWQAEVQKSETRTFSIGNCRFQIPGGIASFFFMIDAQNKKHRLQLPKKEKSFLQISTIEPLDDDHILIIAQEGGLYKFAIKSKEYTKVEGKDLYDLVGQLAKNQNKDDPEKNENKKVVSEYV